MNTVSVTFEQHWPESAWIKDMDHTAEAIWWEWEEIGWLREQGISPSYRQSYTTGHRKWHSGDRGFDDIGYDMEGFDGRVRVYTIVFDVPEDLRTLMLLKWPQAQHRLDF